MATNPLESLRSKLAKLDDHAFGWDGGDALPAREDAAAEAGEFAWHFLRSERFLGLPEPVVGLTGAGTIDVTYHWPEGRLLTFSFQCKGVVTVLQVFEDKDTSIERVIRFDEPGTSIAARPEIVDLLDWILEE